MLTTSGAFVILKIRTVVEVIYTLKSGIKPPLFWTDDEGRFDFMALTAMIEPGPYST